MVTVTIDEANAYQLTRLHNDTWMDVDSDVQISSLAWASRIIDERVTWILDYTDPLNIVSPTIKHAITELAMLLIEKDITTPSNESKYSRLEMDGMAVYINNKFAESIKLIPDYIREMLAPFCVFKKSKINGWIGGRRLNRC